MSGNTIASNITTIPINITPSVTTTPSPTVTTTPSPTVTTTPSATTKASATTTPLSTTTASATTPTPTTKSTTFNAEALFQIFTDSNVVIIMWFLVVYFVVYLILNIVRGRDGVRSSMSKWIDIVALLFLLIYISFTYFDKSEEERKKTISNLYSDFKSYLDSPLSIVSVGFFIFTLYVVIYILSIPMDSFGKPIIISIIENGAWILFVLILFSTFLKYVAGVSLTSFMDDVGDSLKKKAEEAQAATSNTSPSTNTINSIFGALSQSQAKGGLVDISGNTKLSGNASTSNVSVRLDEVFNIGNNMFNYDDAQSVCASYGARLATYDEVESTYNNGGEWCNYGWSDGQAAYFPTQKSTWKNLQQSESTKNACGRPGVNGGFIDNPNIRFGANCFGQKPKPSTSDLASMSSGIGIVIPKKPEDTLLEKKIEFWKNNRDKLLKINSYNNNKWSMY